ncbi:hypothetical protein MPER_07569, partial [Moniliophthora perniciosa FA553]
RKIDMKLTIFCTTAIFLALNVNGQEEGTSASTTFSLPSGGVTIGSTLRPSFTLPFTSGSLPSLTLTGSESLSISPTLPTSLSTSAVSESGPVTVTTTTSVPPSSTTIQTTTESVPTGTSVSPSSTGTQGTITDTATSAGATNTGTDANSASSHSFNGNAMLGMVSGLLLYLSL